MGMIFWIIIIIIIVNISTKKKMEKKTVVRENVPRQDIPVQSAPIQSAPVQNVSRQMTSADRQRLAQYRAKKEKKAGDILSRAQQNARKYEKDTTLEQLEQEHDHSERVKATITKEELQQKKEQHPHDAAHVSELVGEQSDALLGSLEDIMVKGYDGNLSFERDFVGEAMDMINRFTIPDSFSGAGGQ